MNAVGVSVFQRQIDDLDVRIAQLERGERHSAPADIFAQRLSRDIRKHALEMKGRTKRLFCGEADVDFPVEICFDIVQSFVEFFYPIHCLTFLSSIIRKIFAFVLAESEQKLRACPRGGFLPDVAGDSVRKLCGRFRRKRIKILFLSGRVFRLSIIKQSFGKVKGEKANERLQQKK